MAVGGHAEPGLVELDDVRGHERGLPDLRASGDDGELRVGYQRAARLGDWSLVVVQRVPRAFRLRAAVTETHAYWITQGPMDLVLVLGHTEWVWRGVMVAPVDGYVDLDITERPEVAPLLR